MAYRYGNNYRVALGAETAKGSGKTNAAGVRWGDLVGLVLPDTIEFFDEANIIQTGNKTQTGLPTLCETDRGHEHLRVVLSGNLSDEHEFLFKAFGLTKEEITPNTVYTYTMDELPALLPSYVILRIWSDAPTKDGGEDAPSLYTVDIAKGCQLSELKITGTSGDLIKYEATFMADYFATEQTLKIINAASGTSDDPGTICTKGMNFGDVTGTLAFGDGTHLKSFSLTLSSELADDDASFQNSRFRLAVIPVAMTGDLNIVSNYNPDSSEDKAIYSDYLNRRKGAKDTITLVNTNKTFVLTIGYQITGYSFADPDNQLFENNITGRLINTPTISPIIVTATKTT